MSELFFEQAKHQLYTIVQQLGSDDLSAEERQKLTVKAQAFLEALENEADHLRQQLQHAEFEQRQLQLKMVGGKTNATDPPQLEHYRQIQMAGGDADLIYRAMQHANINLIERLKILRTLFNFSLEEARTVEARNP